MELVLIRHTAVDVPRGVCYGQSDVPLKESFAVEAAAVKSLLADEIFDAVYTSPLSRCVRLATFCGYPEAIRDERLKEMDFGDWEMLAFDEIDDERLQAWYDDYLHVNATNGESFQDQLSRVSAFLDELLTKQHERVALFAHGGVLLCAQIFAGVLLPERSFGALTHYGGIIRLVL